MNSETVLMFDGGYGVIAVPRFNSLSVVQRSFLTCHTVMSLWRLNVELRKTNSIWPFPTLLLYINTTLRQTGGIGNCRDKGRRSVLTLVEKFSFSSIYQPARLIYICFLSTGLIVTELRLSSFRLRKCCSAISKFKLVLLIRTWFSNCSLGPS